MKKKSLENFDRHFEHALAITKIKYYGKNSLYFNYHDLKNSCYVVYHKLKEDDGIGSYSSYILTAMMGAIRDYRRRVLKINHHTGVIQANNYDHIDDFKDKLVIGESAYMEAEQIACDVLGNGLLTRREKTVFVLYFIEDRTLQEVADTLGFTESYMHKWKKELMVKLKNLYKEK